MKHLLGGILGLVLAGCAPVVPVFVFTPGEEAVPESRPASEVMNASVVTPRNGTGAIIVTSKDTAWFSEGCTLDVALDDQLVAGLKPGEQVTLFAEPGRRVVSLVTRDAASCDPASTRLAMDIVAHTTQKIRVGSGSRDNLNVEIDPYGRTLPR